MPFFVVAHDRDNGRVTPVIDTVFESRQEALDAVGKLAPDVVLAHRGSDVFLVNLDKATPLVLVMPAGSEPAVTADEPAAVPVEETIAGAVQDEITEEGLADALARATGQLESEGIAAPESVGPPASAPRRRKSRFPEIEAEAEAGPLVEAFVPELAALVEDTAVVVAAPLETDEPEPEPTVDAEEAPDAEAAAEAETMEPVEEPAPGVELVAEAADEAPTETATADAETAWEDVLAETAPEEEAVPSVEEPPVAEAVAEFVPDDLEAPAQEAETLIHAPDEDLLEAGSRTVVMGEYADEAPPAPVAAGSSDEPVPEVATTEASVTESPEEPASEPLPAPTDEQSVAVEESPYSCQDCIYIGTCPKSETDTPSTCGSFQWKAASFKWQDS